MTEPLKIIVVGGTGAFGARLAEMLARDGHDVTVASRGGGGTGFPTPVTPLRFDRTGPLDVVHGFDVVVDAAGPFHAYGCDPYRLARAAIEAGAHYFDLSDNAAFCKGIAALDAQAKAAGVALRSGMSSVPAVSSAAVAALAQGARPLMIDSAILPGNRAPRGRAVIASILHQTGAPFPEIEAGQPTKRRGWSAPKTYDLAGLKRQGWRIEVPDQALFPDHFNCPSVSFRAGLELGVMRYGLGLWSWLRHALRLPCPAWLVTMADYGARLLAPFGSDVGGMVVCVVVQNPSGAGHIRKTWTLLAKDGDGPFVPGVALRAACRDLSALPPGAAPALTPVHLHALEAAMSDLAITTTTASEALTPPFRAVLGAAFDTLAPAVRATHDTPLPRHFEGEASVTRGTGWMARLAALLFGFPPSAKATPVSVRKTPNARGETWERRFGTARFRSHVAPGPNGMTERFGPLTFTLGLNAKDGALHFPVRAGHCLRVQIPRVLLPQSIATETEQDGTFHFDVALRAPTGALLVHYKGWLKPA